MGGESRSRAEVKRVIAEAGRTPPDWWDAVMLDYPASLRLDWPEPREEKRWEAMRNPGQYLTGVVYRRPKTWRAAAKLFHHMLEENETRPHVRARVMDRLGHIYTRLLGDYARGAFWFQSAASAGVTSTEQNVDLARCYGKLGCSDMAVEMLAGLQYPSSSAVLVWAGLGQLERALEVADVAATGRRAATVNLAAGEACRSKGDYKRAGTYYNRVVSDSSRRGRGRDDVYRRCARDAAAALPVMASLNLDGVADGVFKGAASGFRGHVAVTVAVADHAIRRVEVIDHKEDWFFRALEDVPRQMVAQQGFEGVDAVTGATVTSMAIMNAAANALTGR